MVPDGWRKVAVKDALNIEKDGINIGNLHKLGQVAHYSLPAFDNGQTPVIQDASEIASNKSMVPQDCVLLSKLNPRIPRVWRVSHSQELPAVCSTEFWPLTPKIEVNLDFLGCLLRSPIFLEDPLIKPASSTNSHQRIDVKGFNRFELMLPPFDEQVLIAERLSAIDTAIEKTKAVIEQTKRLKQGLLQELLTRGIGHTRFMTTEIGEIPESWDFLPLSHLFSNSKEKGEAGFPIYSVTMNDGLILRDGLDRRTESELESTQHLRIRPNDIAYNTMRMWQGCCGLANNDGLVSPAYFVCRPKIAINSMYYYYLFKTPFMIKLFSDYSYGLTSDRLRLYFKDFALIKVPVPPRSEQDAIVSRIAVIEKSNEILQSELATKSNLRMQAMSDLLSGRIRIS